MKQDRKHIKMLIQKGKNLYIGQFFDEAIEIFTFVLAQEPDNTDAYYYRGLSWANKGEKNKSIEDCNKALEIDPNYPVPIYIRV